MRSPFRAQATAARLHVELLPCLLCLEVRTGTRTRTRTRGLNAPAFRGCRSARSARAVLPDCLRELVQLHLVQLDQTKDLINRDRICIRHLQGEGCAVKGYSSIIDKNDLHHGAQVSVYLRLCRPRRPARRRHPGSCVCTLPPTALPAASATDASRELPARQRPAARSSPLRSRR